MTLGALSCLSFVFTRLHQPALMQHGCRSGAPRRHASDAEEPFEGELCASAQQRRDSGSNHLITFVFCSPLLIKPAICKGQIILRNENMLKPDEIPVRSGGSVALFSQSVKQIRAYLFYSFQLSLSRGIVFLRVPHNVYTHTSSSLFTISSIFPENKCWFPLQLNVHLKSFSKKRNFHQKKINILDKFVLAGCFMIISQTQLFVSCGQDILFTILI